MNDFATRITDIQETIQATCDEAQRVVDDICVIAVSKRQSIEKIQNALDAGHRVFGENRVQEAYDHWHERRAQYPDLQLHLIGPLQSNKVKEAVALFDVIHTVDREKIALKIAQEMAHQNKNIPCFVQVNTGNEPQKSGVNVNELESFVTLCRDELKLDIKGLMCIPPVDDIATFHFALLKKYADTFELPVLSMGMSDDFDKAIKHGAHYIRIGTALFGDRQY